MRPTGTRDEGATGESLSPDAEVGAIEDTYPLSPVQEAMLFHAVASDAADLYMVQQRIEIDGDLEVEIFQQAWNFVTQRHPVLRTRFSWEQNRPPVQVVVRDLDVNVDVIDLTRDLDADVTIEARFESDRRRRFNLDDPPLMRIALFRCAADRHVMLWSQHHLLQDGWSAANVLGEVFAAYEAFHLGRRPELPPVRPFADYIDWLEQRRTVEGERFWRRQLEGFSLPTRMAPPRPDAGGGSYTRLFRALTEDSTTALRDFARDRGLTLNSILVGALALTIARYTGRRDVALGVVTAGRPSDLDGVEAMVGMFINTLILRLAIDGRVPVGTWLAEVQARQAAVLEHDHSALTDVQSWSELAPGTTPTDVLFAYWSFGGSGAAPSGSPTYRIVEGYGRTSFPFSVTVESADPISVGLDFDAADFDSDRAERFLEHFATLLESILAAPEAPVGTLEMFTPGERRTRAAYNETVQTVPFASIVDAFRTQAASSPAAAAVVADGGIVSYAELDERSDRLAAEIIQVGNFAVSRVAIMLPRGPEMIVAMMGVLKAGAAYVPIDRHLPPRRVEYLLADSGAGLVITDEQLRAVLPNSAPEAITVPLDDSAVSDLDFEIPVGGDDLAYVMYTSGSTGLPKGVLVTHRGMINYVWGARLAYVGNTVASFPLFTSPGFDLTVTSIFVPLVSGGEIVVYPDDDPRDLAVRDVFSDDRVDVVKLTPSHLALLDDDLFATERIRTLILGGEDLRADAAHSVLEAAACELILYNEYGPTETTVGCMIHRFDRRADVSGSVPIGKPSPNARIYVLDAHGAPVPIGVEGELYVAGDGVARGYLDQPELTGDAFVPDPFRPGERMYRTGDLARFKLEGVLEYRGRADEQLKVRGNRIEPGEIEAVLAEHPAVSGAAVAVREPSPGDVRLVAYYVPEPSLPENVTELRRHLRDRLPDVMVPRHLVRIGELPLSANGKLNRNALPDTIGEVISSAAMVEPRTDAERLVAGISAELLGVERVSITDNLFDLGGHSILAMQLIARLHRETGVRLSPRVILLDTLARAASLLPTAPAELSLRVGTPTTSARGVDTVASTAVYFGPAAEPLFGMHSAPTGSAVRGRAVLLCPPLGWEQVRTHWALRKLARMLAADGFHVLRFDYHGTGDSSGVGGEPTVDRWVDDIATAAAELKESAGVDEVALVGVRLGASLAAIACARGLPCEQLVLWDPVVQGSAYLRTLERMHAEMLALRRGRLVTAMMQDDELLGFPYPEERRRALAGIDLIGLTWPEVPTTLIASQSRLEYRRLSHAAGAIDFAIVSDVGGWGDLASTQTAMLPIRVPQHVVNLLAGDA